MTSHRIIVFRSWHRDDGATVRPNIFTGYPKQGTPRWNVDCITCGRSLGTYDTEQEAKQVRCAAELGVNNPSTQGPPPPSPQRAACRSPGAPSAAHRLTIEERQETALPHAEAVKIRRGEAA